MSIWKLELARLLAVSSTMALLLLEYPLLKVFFMSMVILWLLEDTNPAMLRKLRWFAVTTFFICSLGSPPCLFFWAEAVTSALPAEICFCSLATLTSASMASPLNLRRV